MLRNFRPLALSLVILGLLLPMGASSTTSGTAFGAGFGHHPRYLHARSDLRAAWIILGYHDEPNVQRHCNAVRGEIAAAIRELDNASVIDHKDIDDHPHVDTSLDRPGRFRKVFALLRSARTDISEEEDNPRAIGWRDAAYRHIDGALDQLRRAARDLNIDRIEGY
ncbi:MAG TPA: hypothetical protein VLZ81_02740 [Blastocatellia bacterium]|nr:hypothetical protein [Blastocatellia bacterium]